MQEAFDIHIEKRPENKHGNLSFSIFFDNETNPVLAEKIDNRVAVMECVYKNEGFLATGFHVRGRREPVRTNRRLPVRLKFHVNQRLGCSNANRIVYTSSRITNRGRTFRICKKKNFQLGRLFGDSRKKCRCCGYYVYLFLELALMRILVSFKSSVPESEK